MWKQQQQKSTNLAAKKINSICFKYQLQTNLSKHSVNHFIHKFFLFDTV